MAKTIVENADGKPWADLLKFVVVQLVKAAETDKVDYKLTFNQCLESNDRPTVVSGILGLLALVRAYPEETWTFEYSALLQVLDDWPASDSKNTQLRKLVTMTTGEMGLPVE